MRNYKELLQEIDARLESPPNTPKPSPNPEVDQPADAAIEEDELLASLTRHFGHTGFRATQREIIEAILNGEDVLAAFPTGIWKIPLLPTARPNDARLDRRRVTPNFIDEGPS